METLPSYNPELAKPLTLSDGQKVQVVTPGYFAAFAESRGESFMGANREFMKIFRSLGSKGLEGLGGARVVDQNYESSLQRTRFGQRTGLGIKVAYFSEVTQKVRTMFSSGNTTTIENFEAYNEALFMLPEKRQLLNLLVLVHEQRKASTPESR